ncbi:ArsR/SmtB family transcription factor [Microbacterium gorillae]|uniref:ArsR/SmtB family transcription factor n=1 Tax=Microbacterium gorillae TaxID=1231063 RepID=UPI00058CD5B1|nr:metalloregulator ArsR/SmtB family transcription factor [Microbacterium gorillae]
MTATMVFAALGDPVRADIVQHLDSGPATVSELAALFPISLQAVSRHVGVLADAGIVTRTRDGRSRTVELRADTLDEAAQWLERRRRRLEERYRRLDDVLADLTAPPLVETEPTGETHER